MRRLNTRTLNGKGMVGAVDDSKRFFIRSLFGSTNNNSRSQDEKSSGSSSSTATPSSSQQCIAHFPQSVEDPKGAFVGNFPTADACLDADNFYNKVPYLRPTATLIDASIFLRKFDVGCVPVLDENKKVVGMFSERDLARWVGNKAIKNPESTDTSAHSTTVAEIMSRDVIFCTDETTFEAALALMDKHNFRHLPVMSSSESTELVGLLSMRDIMHQHIKGKGKGDVDDFMHWVLKMSS